MHVPAIPIFEVYPQLNQVSQATLQSLCDDWLLTPIAKEFAIDTLRVETIDTKLSLVFGFSLTHQVVDKESYYFPTDELLYFIADKLFADEAGRDAFKREVATRRQRGGPDVFRRFTIHTGPKLPLFLTCKNCGNVMQTQYTAFRNETITEYDDGEGDCPRCMKTFTFQAEDFHFEPGT